MKIDELKNREKALREREAALVAKAGLKRQAVFERFPMVFTLLGSFGLVATLYGFERIIDRIEFFSDNPIALFLTGIAVLIGTGSLYKRLQ